MFIFFRPARTRPPVARRGFSKGFTLLFVREPRRVRTETLTVGVCFALLVCLSYLASLLAQQAFFLFAFNLVANRKLCAAFRYRRGV